MSSLLRASLSTTPRTIVRSRFAGVSPVRTIMTLKEYKYTAHATASGQGRNGEVTSDDDVGLKLRLAMPRSLGGKGDGNNPEQLFAMGYAACFLSALQLVAGQKGKSEAAKNATIHASVHIGQPEGSEGFGLAVDIRVEGIEDQELIDAGHAACPYSRALKHGAVVNVSKGTQPPDPTGSRKAEGSSASASSSGSGSSSSGISNASNELNSDKADAKGTTQSGSGTAGYQ